MPEQRLRAEVAAVKAAARGGSLPVLSNVLLAASGKSLTLSATDLDLLLAYERPENHNGDGTNVLYADLRIAHLDMYSFQEALKKTQEYLKEHPAKGKAKEKGDDF